MDYTELIRNRESIRNYDPERPVPEQVLKKILEAGRLAPSACNNQPWKFLVISSPGMLKKVRAAYPRDWFCDAPNVLIVLGLKDKAWKRGFDGYNSLETDVTIAMTQMILAAENEDVGTCWIANYNPELLKEAINPGMDQVIFCMTPLGYQRKGFKKAADKKRKSLEEVTEFL